MIKNRKKIIIIGVFLLIIMLGVTYAFFNYMRTGASNVLKVGRIYFNSNQTSSITLTNIYPMSKEEAINSNLSNDNITIEITGDTTYSEGIEYLVTVEEINSTVNGKKIPMSLFIDNSEDIGDIDDDYYENRGGNTSIYKPLADSVVIPGQYLLVGYIAPGATGIDGEIRIKSYIDENKIIVSNTEIDPYEYSNTTNGVFISNPSDKVYLTTNEWNSIDANHPLTFKIKIEANEGIWVDPETNPNAMNQISYPKNTGVKEIKFIKETPIKMNERYNAAGNNKADLTYNNEGKVLAWQENDILYIASSGETYLTVASGLFSGFNTVEKITFENVNLSRVSNLTAFFASLPALKTADLRKLDTSNVTQMSALFSGCTNLEYVNLSGLGSNSLTTISGLFSGCTKIKEIDMSEFNFGTSSMSYQFSGLSNLETINLSNANTSSVTNMSGMFNNCSKLIDIDLSNLGGNSLTTVADIFYGCSSLKTINMSGFNFGTADLKYNSNNSRSPFTSAYNVEEINLSNAIANGTTSLNNSFYNLDKLKTINLSNMSINSTTNMSGILSYCDSLESVNLSGTGSSVLTDVSGMFYDDAQLKEINMSGFDFGTSSLASFLSSSSYPKLETINFANADMDGVTSMKNMLSNLTKLSNINFSNVTTSSITNMDNMFQNDSSLTSLNLSGMGSKNLTSISTLFQGCTNLEEVDFSNFIFGTSMQYIFAYAPALKTINLTNADTSTVTSMYGVFYDVDSLERMDVSHLNTEKVTDMGRMFGNCNKLKYINMSNLGSNFLYSMSDIFYNSSNLETIIMDNFNFGIMTQLGQQAGFRYLNNLITVSIKNSNASSITNMDNAFYQCSNIETIDFTGTNFDNLESLNETFRECSSLETLDLSTFDTSNVTKMSSLFQSDSSLKTVYVSNKWSTGSVTSSISMFSGCTSLVGGNGTTYDSTKTDKEYARIDTASTPGYLTLKTN